MSALLNFSSMMIDEFRSIHVKTLFMFNLWHSGNWILDMIFYFPMELVAPLWTT